MTRFVPVAKAHRQKKRSHPTAVSVAARDIGSRLPPPATCPRRWGRPTRPRADVASRRPTHDPPPPLPFTHQADLRKDMDEFLATGSHPATTSRAAGASSSAAAAAAACPPLPDHDPSRPHLVVTLTRAAERGGAGGGPLEGAWVLELFADVVPTAAALCRRRLVEAAASYGKNVDTKDKKGSRAMPVIHRVTRGHCLRLAGSTAVGSAAVSLGVEHDGRLLPGRRGAVAVARDGSEVVVVLTDGGGALKLDGTHQARYTTGCGTAWPV